VQSEKGKDGGKDGAKADRGRTGGLENHAHEFLNQNEINYSYDYDISPHTSETNPEHYAVLWRVDTSRQRPAG
jgi:hypothetical protein